MASHHFEHLIKKIPQILRRRNKSSMLQSVKMCFSCFLLIFSNEVPAKPSCDREKVIRLHLTPAPSHRYCSLIFRNKRLMLKALVACKLYTLLDRSFSTMLSSGNDFGTSLVMEDAGARPDDL